MLGISLAKQHPWVIQIMNTDGNLPPDDRIWPLDFSWPGYTYLEDNALKITINTLNLNVKTKKATINAYLNKFVYSNKNANKGNNITTNLKLSAKENNLKIHIQLL